MPGRYLLTHANPPRAPILSAFAGASGFPRTAVACYQGVETIEADVTAFFRFTVLTRGAKQR
jgi:hypothetical protein